jgi:hypothetical protein
MSLVVARITPLGVRVSADMRITDPAAVGAPGFLNAQLKIILVSPTLCVAFANNSGAAIEAIRRLSGEGNGDLAEDQLLDEHKRSEPKAEFVVARLDPPRLVAIKDARAEESAAAWLGDREAFAEYQQHYHDDHARLRTQEDMHESIERATDLDIAVRMGTGMGAVVFGPATIREGDTLSVMIPSGGRHPTVGEAVINAGPRVEDNLFAYFHQNRATAPFGSAAGGGFSYFVLTPTEPGIGAIGLYFAEGRLGVLYAPLLLDQPERYPNLSAYEFMENVRERRGVCLRGLVGEDPGA